MKRKFKGGMTSLSLPVIVYDNTSTTGAGLSGLTHTTSGLVLEYRRAGSSSWTSVTLVSKMLGTYVSGGIVASGSRAGRYEIDIPDAAIAAGVRMVEICLRGAANMHPVDIEIELDAVDYQDANSFGLSRIDATVSSRASQTSVDTLATYVDTEVAAIKAKTDLIEAFPANFSLLMISGSGAIGLVDELGPQALAANSLEADIASQVWNTLTADTFTDQSFGDRLLISANNTRQVAVTGSGHVSSVLHDAEPDSIPEDAFVTGSISARAIGTDAIDADALASSANTEIANAVAATQALSRLDSMIESDGAGQFRFDVIALENAPAGGGGGGGTDWTANERSAIRSIFGFDSSGNISIPSLGVLDAIKDKTDLITTGTIQSSIPVTSQGQITGPLYIGDDYLSANGRAFQWTVALPSGFVIATSTCRFGMEHAEGATTGASFAVAGTVTDAGSGNVTLSFDVAKATTGTLKAGFYRWSVEIASAGGNEVTRVASDGKKLVEWREKQT